MTESVTIGAPLPTDAMVIQSLRPPPIKAQTA